MIVMTIGMSIMTPEALGQVLICLIADDGSNRLIRTVGTELSNYTV